MPSTHPKAHEIESMNSVLPTFTILILLLTVSSIVLLGVIGDSNESKEVRAKESPSPAASAESLQVETAGY